jgi:hypothetical protein
MKRTACTIAAVTLAVIAVRATAGGEGTTVTIDGLKSTTPSSWKAEPVNKKFGRFRKYQIAIPKAGKDKEDAELLVLDLEGAGGNNDANIKRWQGMFSPPQGKSLDDVTKVDKFKVGEVPVVYVDISGTYLTQFPPFAPNAKVIPKENYRLLGVIFESKNGPYYIKMTGPAPTVAAHKDEFDKWLKGFK